MVVRHMKSDPNAVKHADIGLASAVAAWAYSLYSGLPLGTTMEYILIAPFVAGALLEVAQRVWRGVTGSDQNTLLENYLDTMQTGLFYVTFYVNRRVTW